LVVQDHADVFKVQQNIDDVFLHTFDGRVLVLDTIDLDFSNGATGH